MRKIAVSSKQLSRILFRARADARSVPKGFSAMTRAFLGAAGLGQLLDHLAEEDGRNGEIVCRPLGAPEFLAQCLEGRVIGVIAVDIAQQPAQFFPRGRVEPAVLLQAVFGARLELLQVPARLGHADHGHREMPALQHRLQRREDFLVREVARRAKENQCVGMRSAHRAI